MRGACVSILILLLAGSEGGCSRKVDEKLTAHQKEQAQADIKAIGDAAAAWQIEHPNDCPGVPRLRASGGLKVQPLDPWGTKYQVVCNGERIQVTSIGPDKVENTADDLHVTATPPSPVIGFFRSAVGPKTDDAALDGGKAGPCTWSTRPDRPPPITLTKELLVSALATDGKEVFWLRDDTRGGRIVRMLEAASPTGQVRFLVPKVESAKSLVVGNGEVFWADQGEIRAVKIGGGSVRKVADESGTALVADSTALYWFGTGGIRFRGYKDTFASTAASIGGDVLAVDPDFFYVGSALTLSAVNRLSRQTLKLAEGDSPTAIVADSDAVYWAGGGAIRKLVKRTGEVTKLSENPFCARTDVLIQDHEALYVVCHNVGRQVTHGQGMIVRIRKAGGCTDTVASGLDSVKGLVVQDDAIVYADKGVVRMPR